MAVAAKAGSHNKSSPGKAGAARGARTLTRRSNGPVALSKDEEVSAYRDMLMIRRFEEKAGQMYGMGLIGGFCHL